jgi:pilus assembly protein Flp/PilA
MEKIRTFFKDEEGVTAIEYALIASLLAVVIIGAVITLGTTLNAGYTNLANHIK